MRSAKIATVLGSKQEIGHENEFFNLRHEGKTNSIGRYLEADEWDRRRQIHFQANNRPEPIGWLCEIRNQQQRSH